jgi:hypothetical protein
MAGMSDMNVRIAWSPEHFHTVLAALDADAAPRLEPSVAAEVRRAAAQGPPLELSLTDGQLLMRWCEARRERASEQQPDAQWTRIVAEVHEAVQPAAPAPHPSR